MAKYLVLVVCALFAISKASYLNPRDLASEAAEQAQELESIVRGQIIVAHNDLEDIASDFVTNSLTVTQTAQISLEEEQAIIQSQLQSVKDLANSAGKDVTSCTDIREELLGRLPQEFLNTLLDCVATVNIEAQGITSDARYIVDITINKVHTIQSQLRACRQDILCLSPLVTEIQLNKIRLPQNIQTEVQAAQTLVTTLRLSTQQCSDTNVSGYASEASSILGDIIDCVNRILSKIFKQ